jgi:ribosomal protein L32E
MTTPMERAWQNEAFASALKELFKRYPLPKYKYQKVAWRRDNDRQVALRNARAGNGLYLITMFAHKVPPQEIETVHALIYG